MINTAIVAVVAAVDVFPTTVAANVRVVANTIIATTAVAIIIIIATVAVGLIIYGDVTITVIITIWITSVNTIIFHISSTRKVDKQVMAIGGVTTFIMLMYCYY